MEREEDETLGSLYHKAHLYFVLIVGNDAAIDYSRIKHKGGDTIGVIPTELPTAPNEVDRILDSALAVLAATQRKVYSEGMISKNEELDDINTGVLRFLFLPYMAAKVHAQYRNLRFRLSHLLEARTFFQDFLQSCKRYKLLHKDEIIEVDADESVISPQDRRTMKIEKYKREKESTARIKALTSLICRDDEDNDGNSGDYDEELRELLTLRLQSCARDAINELAMMKEEMRILEHMAELRELEEEFPAQDTQNTTSKTNVTATGSGSAAVSIPSEHLQQLGLPGPTPEPLKPGSGPGLNITKTSKVGDQVVLTRDTVRATVFEPRMKGPTMTLEEFADIERAQAEERSRREAEAQSNAPDTRRSHQLVADGDEDNIDLVDKAIMEDRKWDAFKEENPRGWGNKAGKRF